jgi:hypothetical protein
MMDMQLDLPLFESTLDADITVKCRLSHAVRWSFALPAQVEPAFGPWPSPFTSSPFTS